MAANPLRQLTRRPVGIKVALTSMFMALETEDDRSAAISAGALVELALEKAIKHRLRRMKKSDEALLFEGTAPLATFSAKCRIGYALSIYGKDIRHDLETINAIRNVFAHSVHHVTFRNRRITNQVYGMHAMKEMYEGKRPKPLNARNDFLGLTQNFWLQFVMMAGPRLPLLPPFPALAPSKRPRLRRARSIAE